MMDEQEWRHVAQLARLSFTAQEQAAYTAQVSRIVEFVGVLANAPCPPAPMAHPFESAVRLREDRVTEGDEREMLLANAPQLQDGLFVVPLVLDA
jgi:aspartyl-tRNA(Asn)/glutamyl-tRNA(Gln) amidotransferase subunit C